MKIPLDSRTYAASENESMTKPRGISSGELARASGISADTLRHYELRGLLPVPAKSASGQRRYGPEAVRRVQVVRAALAFGFTVHELGDILARRDRGEAPCHDVHRLAQQKLVELGTRLRQMQALHRTMRRTLSDWEKRLKSTPQKQQAGLLYALSEAYPKLAAEGSPQLSPGLRHHIRSQKKGS